MLLAAEEIVTFPPVALIVNTCFVVEPTSTLPKFSVLGAIVSVPAVGVMPVPVKGISTEGPAMKTLLPSRPALCGAKVTVNVTLVPGATVNGTVGPVTENPGLMV